MSKLNKVPRGINIQPPFAWGLNGNQFIFMTALFLLLGIIAMAAEKKFFITAWLSNFTIMGIAYLLCRISNAFRRATIKHIIYYFFRKIRVPKRYTGRGIKDIVR